MRAHPRRPRRATTGRRPGGSTASSSATGELDRRSFEHVLGGLARAGLVAVSDASFQKDGERIAFQRVSLTDAGAERGTEALGYVPIEQEEAARPRKRKKKAAASASSGTSGSSTLGTSAADAARRAFFAKKARAGRRRGKKH